MSNRRIILLALICCLAAGSLSAASQPLNLPISFELERAATVTVVIEDAAGMRVRNLASAVRLPPGKNLLSWDGYDEGTLQKDGSLVRKLVAPGRYRARGLTSDGLRLIYEFPFNSPGNPPWFTKERNGAWLADHTSAQAVVFAPASDTGFLGKGQSRLIFAAKTAECGDAFMATDLDGKKIIGNNDFGWSGAYAMAIDRGPQAPSGDDDPWLYCLMFGDDQLHIDLFSRSGKTSTPFKQKVLKKYTWNGGLSGDSIAAWNGTVVISVAQDNVLLIVRPQDKKKLIGAIDMKDLRGVLFDGQGRLLVATGTQVKRLSIDLAKAKLITDEVLVAKGLEDAQQMALDKAGNLYVGDWGTQHVVKVFSPTGSLIRTIGKPGGLQLGPFDAERLHRPKGLAIDERDQLWVVDAEHLPKRITAWSIADGKLVKTFVGGPKYGGGGHLDPDDRSKLYYGIYDGGYRFTLDWDKGTAVVDSVYMREKGKFRPQDQDRDTIIGDVPEDVMRVGSNTYLVSRGSGIGTIWLVGADGVPTLAAMIGGPHLQENTHGSWNPTRNPGTKELFATLNYNHLLIWSDVNRDGRAQPEEFVNWKLDVPYAYGARFNPDLSFILRGYALPAPKILPNGVPVWSVENPPVPVLGSEHPDNAVPAGEGLFVHCRWGDPRHTIQGFRNKQLVWTYPYSDGSVIPSNPGTVIMPRGFLGVPFVARQGEAGTVLGLNGEKGSLYLITSDGLFIQDIAGDMRVRPHIGQKYPVAKRGMVVEEVSFSDEHYGPSLSQTKEGEVILIAGKEFSALFRVDGLASVKRRVFATVEIDAARLAGLPETLTEVPRQQGRLSLSVGVGGKAPQVDGTLSPGEWPTSDIAWAKLDARASATLRIVGDRLYAAWRTGDSAALANATGEPKLIFKRGGAVDLMIASDPTAKADRREPTIGDLRLIASMQAGKPTAVIYRAVVPKTAEADRVPFESPVGRVVFDRVEVVSDQIRLAQREGDIELSIPLAVLGLAPSATEGTVLLGDIGLLRGTGAMTTQRLYWNNLDTSICSDVPSEARLMPANWGNWQLVPMELAQRIAANAAPADLVAGLSWRAYGATWAPGMDLSKLAVIASGVASRPDLIDTKPGKQDRVVVYQGFVTVPRDGTWTFAGKAKAGCRIWLGDNLVLDGLAGGDISGSPVDLAAGLHPFRLEHIQKGGGPSLMVEWSGPGQPRKPIAAESFRRSP